MQTLAEQFAQAIEAKFDAENALKALAGGHDYKGHDFGVQPGVKFDRITMQSRYGSGMSVHAFVEKGTGRLVKAAGWKAPAKRANGDLQSKFDLSTPEGFQEALNAADFAGGYLYL